jgi:hypothetical protein
MHLRRSQVCFSHLAARSSFILSAVLLCKHEIALSTAVKVTDLPGYIPRYSTSCSPTITRIRQGPSAIEHGLCEFHLNITLQRDITSNWPLCISRVVRTKKNVHWHQQLEQCWQPCRFFYHSPLFPRLRSTPAAGEWKVDS